MQLKKKSLKREKTVLQNSNEQNETKCIKTFGFMVFHSFVWFVRSFVFHSFTRGLWLIHLWIASLCCITTLSTSMNLYWKCLFFSLISHIEAIYCIPIQIWYWIFRCHSFNSFLGFWVKFITVQISSLSTSSLPSAWSWCFKVFFLIQLRQVYWRYNNSKVLEQTSAEQKKSIKDRFCLHWNYDGSRMHIRIFKPFLIENEAGF